MLHGFAVNVPLMGTKTSGKSLRDVQKLVDDCFFFLSFRQLIISLRNDLDDIRRWEVEGFLPDSAEAVDASDRSSGRGPLASDAEEKLRNNMKEL